MKIWMAVNLALLVLWVILLLHDDRPGMSAEERMSSGALGLMLAVVVGASWLAQVLVVFVRAVLR